MQTSDVSSKGLVLGALHGWAERVIAGRRAQIARSAPASTARLDDVVRRAALRNAAIASGMALVPGPVGVIVASAEIWLIARNQLRLVVDVAAAHGKGDAVTAGDALALVFGDDLPQQLGSTRLARRAVGHMAGHLATRSLRVVLGRWVPVVGAVGLAVWTRRATAEVGERARERYGAGAAPAAKRPARPTPPPVSRDTTLTARTRRARYAILANVLRATPVPSVAQISWLDDTRLAWEDDGCELPTPAEVLAAEDDLAVNAPLFADRALAREALEDAIALALLSDPDARPPVGHLLDLAATLGLPEDVVAELAAA